MKRWLCAVVLVSACATSDAGRWHITVDRAAVARRDAWVQGPPLTPKRKVNVVLIVADDLGRADTSMYPEGRVATPNLDRIAQDGVRFDQGYVTSALCSPSRASLLTGRYQQRFGHEVQPHDRYVRSSFEAFFAQLFLTTDDWRLLGVRAPAEEDVEKQGLPKSEVLLPELLHRAGYATAMFGKWHLGWNDDFQPHHRGFDDFEGFYEAYSLYASPVDQPGIVNQHLPEFSDRFIWGRGRSGIASLVRNGTPVEESRYLTDVFTDEAVAFIDAHREQPFFLYLPFQNPHTPFQAKQEDFDAFPDEKDPIRRTYLALIRSLDHSVGRVLDAIEARGLSDDTLVIFLSDNGPALYTHATSAAPSQGGKFTLFEGGLKVPFAMRWPNGLPKGAHVEAPVSAVDVVTTVASAVGIPLPDDRTYDGVDLVPFVTGAGTPHEALFWRADYTSAIRRGPLKLIHDAQAGQVTLFDLALDPGETQDLSTSRPDDVKRLQAELDAWNATLAAPLWPSVMGYRFVANDGRAWWYPL